MTSAKVSPHRISSIVPGTWPAPENVKFEAVEPATPEELAEPIERLLGLEAEPERERAPASDEDEFEVPPEIEGGGNVP